MMSFSARWTAGISEGNVGVADPLKENFSILVRSADALSSKFPTVSGCSFTGFCGMLTTRTFEFCLGLACSDEGHY